MESGDHAPFFTRNPVMSVGLFDSEFDWSFRTEPSGGRYCMGMENQSCVVHSGRAVGGSTVINGMLYFRGHREDYDEWARLGNRGAVIFSFMMSKENLETLVFYLNRLEL